LIRRRYRLRDAVAAGGGEIRLGSGTAEGINNRGLIGSTTFPDVVPVLWDTQGRLGGSAGPVRGFTRGINSRGWAIGVTYGSDFPRAFVWEPQNDVVVMLSPDASEAFDINDRGDVLGTILNSGYF